MEASQASIKAKRIAEKYGESGCFHRGLNAGVPSSLGMKQQGGQQTSTQKENKGDGKSGGKDSANEQHVVNPLLFRKWISVQEANLLKNDESLGCRLCFASGYRYGRSMSSGFEPGYNEKDLEDWKKAVDVISFERGIRQGQKDSPDYYSYTEEPYDDLAQPSQGYVFCIDEGQFGELPHLLISKLLRPLSITLVENNAGELGKLFGFYGFLNLQPQKNAYTNPKDETTAIICSVFGYALKQNAQQESVFAKIRELLDRVPISKHLPFFSTRHDLSYCPVSSLGKFWINRFLTITNQGISTSSEPTKFKLPKKETVGRMALIYVRGGQAVVFGRSMNDDNVIVCLKAIKIANARAATLTAHKFTHVLFYGDISNKDGDRLVKLGQTELNPKSSKEPIKIFYISQPWGSSAETGGDATQKLWQAYREDKIDIAALPWGNPSNKSSKPDLVPTVQAASLQVKYLAFFLALQARYQERLCYIGFRSGFLDWAGFIGSPVFFIDNGWFGRKIAEKKLAEEWLCLPIDSGVRMEAASNTINTFIRIDIRGPPANDKPDEQDKKSNTKRGKSDAKDKKPDAKDGKPDAKDRNAELLWDLTSPKITEYESPGKVPFTGRLAAALYIFMLAGEKDSKPLWTKRVVMLQAQQDAINKPKEAKPIGAGQAAGDDLTLLQHLRAFMTAQKGWA